MPETKEFTSEELEAALFEVFDLFETALIDFFPMGQTALQMHDNAWLKGAKLELGVKDRDLAESTLDILKIAKPNIDITEKKIIMEHNGVPIEIRRIKKHYRVLDNLDMIDYAYETFLFPNPFDAFVRMMNFMH